jgi:hypothetical protein
MRAIWKSAFVILGSILAVISADVARASSPPLQLPWPTGQQQRIVDGYTYGCGTHDGPDDNFAIDFAGGGWQTSATASGTVSVVDLSQSTGLGIYVEVNHGRGYRSRYAHLSSVASGIQVGAVVRQGQVLGITGSTGYVTGPHLHFYLMLNGTGVKPEPMSWVTGFGNWGTKQPNCVYGGTPSPYWTSKPPANQDYNGDGCADLMGRLSSNGDLRRHAGPCSASYAGAGVHYGNLPNANFDRLLGAGGFSADGCVDMIARRTSDQAMRLYPGASPPACNAQGFGMATTIGTNWGSQVKIFSPRDFNGDGCSDVIGVDSGGVMRLYTGNTSGGNCLGTSLTGGNQIGEGWADRDIIVGPGDFSGDGCFDVIARRPSTDQLELFRGNCQGGFGTVSIIGTGWNQFTAIIAPGDWDNDGCVDLVGRMPDGILRLYRGNCASGFFGSFTQIGNGWGVYNAIF